MDLLLEGIYDKGIFKAVFMAGGPGSGKSFISSNIFGIPTYKTGGIATTSISGLKVVSSDHEFKYLLKQYGFDPEWLDQYPPGTFDEPGGMRDFAKDLTKQRKLGYMAGKIGMIIDGTGHKYSKIKAEKKFLEKQGYDTSMVFVMTTLETAQARNRERGKKGDRVLSPKILEASWRGTRKNLGAYKALFKQNFKLVYNDKYLDDKEARHFFVNIIKGPAAKFAVEPIKNPVGQKWVQDHIDLKNRGIK